MKRFLLGCLILLSCCLTGGAQEAQSWLAIEGGTLFDGTGAVRSGVVILIRGDRIEEIGSSDRVPVPAQARRIDARGKFILPGFVDLHFHYDPTQTPWLPLLFLAQGVTTLRDLGNWIEDNDGWLTSTRAQGLPTPRLLYAGPHLDGTHPAYPNHSFTLLDEADARRVTNQLIEKGATSLKVYFRLPLALAAAVIEEAKRHGVPVHAHLEIVDPRDLIPLGLDGIEHTSSVGRALLSPKESEAFRQAVLKDNSARGPGRYQVWAGIDPDGERASALIELMREHDVNLDATLAIFEPRRGEGESEQRWAALQNMADFTIRYHRAGGAVTIGSHGTVPNASPGFAFQRELEMHVEAGMSPSDALQAATRVGAAALRLDDRGVLAPGKLADILLLEGDPLQDISNVGRVHTVILGGKIVDREALLATQPAVTGPGNADLSE